MGAKTGVLAPIPQLLYTSQSVIHTLSSITHSLSTHYGLEYPFSMLFFSVLFLSCAAIPLFHTFSTAGVGYARLKSLGAKLDQESNLVVLLAEACLSLPQKSGELFIAHVLNITDYMCKIVKEREYWCVGLYL